MDNESRHELQENDLVKGLGKARSLWQKHGTTFLIAILLVLGGYTLMQWRGQSAQQSAETARLELASAFSMLQSLEGVRLDPDNVQAFVARRDELYTSIESSLHNVLDSAREDEIKAAAALLTGQLNWKLAQLPTPAGATTRPALALARTPDQLIEDAATSFETVLNQFAHTPSSVDAQFGLAAIAEQRGSFDRAATLYQQIESDPAAREGHQLVATARLRLLRDLQLLGSADGATTRPATTRPATQPAE